MPDNQPNQFSQLIASIFAKLGISEPWAETILLVDRRYVGRKFRAGGIQIIWWIEKNLVEVVDEDLQVVESLGLEQKLEKSA
jgi:hypothetical protein